MRTDVGHAVHDQAVLRTGAGAVDEVRDGREEAAGEYPFADKVDFLLVCILVQHQGSNKQQGRGRGGCTFGKAGFGDGNCLDASYAAFVQRPVDDAKVSLGELFPAH